MTGRTRSLAGAVVASALTALAAPAAFAATPTDTTPLQRAVAVGNDKAGIMAHLKALQGVADRSGGNRATGTIGHERSADYVISKLPTSYFNVSSQPFTARVFSRVAAPTLSATPAPSPGWTADVDFTDFEFTGSGALSNAPIDVIDYVTPTSQASASSAGCEDADFPAGATSLAGKVAVIQRGTCDFGVKVVNAIAHGAAAVIIFNEGTIGDPDRNGLIGGTLGDYPAASKVPVLDLTYAAGLHLVKNETTARVTLSTAGKIESLPTRNVIAATKAGRTDRQVVVGAHLDSVPEGPGINDDGSGTATDLEVALQMAKLGIKPVNQVKFVWFSGEEQGLYGSEHYASQLGKAGIANTQAMLDFDMLASPNYAIDIYDGDGSELGSAGPNGSGSVESVFQGFFDSRKLYSEKTEFDGRSDYVGFTDRGIPAGGITTGAEVHKTPFQQTKWGGTVSDTLAGQYDPCYHLACDSYPGNINATALDFMSDAVAHAVLTFAQTTSAVNGTEKGSSKATKSYDWKGDHHRR